MPFSLYHIHAVIPGQRFDSFLREVVAFLLANEDEIVVIRTCADGIKECEIPSHTVIQQHVLAAIQNTSLRYTTDIGIFGTPIYVHRMTNTRIILMLDNAKYDSYLDTAYATLHPTPIINQFKKMNTAGQSQGDFTVLQCQVSQPYCSCLMNRYLMQLEGNLSSHQGGRSLRSRRG